MRELRARSKVWLEIGGAPFLGDGRARLLDLIHRHGSISAAAREMDISYRKAWSQLLSMERLLAFPLVTRQKGGAGRGETRLTPEAIALLDRYGRMEEAIRSFADETFTRIFKTEI